MARIAALPSPTPAVTFAPFCPRLPNGEPNHALAGDQGNGRCATIDRSADCVGQQTVVTKQPDQEHDQHRARHDGASQTTALGGCPAPPCQHVVGDQSEQGPGEEHRDKHRAHLR